MAPHRIAEGKQKLPPFSSSNKVTLGWGCSSAAGRLRFGPAFYFGKNFYGSLHLAVGPSTGTLRPAPVGRQIEAVPFDKVGLSGWKLVVGSGFGYGWKTVFLGGDIVYSTTTVTLDEDVYVNLDRTSSFGQVGFNIFFGVHL